MSATSSLLEALRTDLGHAVLGANQSLARYTAWRIGGPAELLVVAESIEDLQKAVTLAWEHQVPCRVLGGGSNVLISDAGVPGLVVLNRARRINILPAQADAQTARVKADSGASLSTVARLCVSQGLAGLEWAASIPGTIGGAVVGNAGAWGGDVASTLLQTTILETDGQVAQWPVNRLEYGYRTSALKGQPGDGRRPVVLEAEFALRPGERSSLEARVAEIRDRRKAGQPEGATCGSVFRNPPDDYAGRLIEAAGLKGQRCGMAEISTKHANFIVNQGGASAGDVKALIDLARNKVKMAYGVALELEIDLLGNW